MNEELKVLLSDMAEFLDVEHDANPDDGQVSDLYERVKGMLEKEDPIREEIEQEVLRLYQNNNLSREGEFLETGGAEDGEAYGGYLTLVGIVRVLESGSNFTATLGGKELMWAVLDNLDRKGKLTRS